MANLNKVMLIGRLTRDPEVRTFSTGGKVANFGFAVNDRRKNTQTGQWEDAPVFLDCEAFNRADGGRALADLVENSLHKGTQVFLEGHLRLDQWQDKNDGSKRSKLKIVVDNVQFLEPRADGGAGGGEGSGYRSARPAAPAPASAGGARRPSAPPQPANNNYDEPPEMMDPPHGEGGEEIPF